MTNHDLILFGAADYVVFALMLVVSLAIGVFFAVKDRKSKSTQTYLLGGRNMNFYAVGMSLSFTFISAVTILGIPAEIYLFGPMYGWLLLSSVIAGIVVNEIYVPLYFRLEITSSYEYLERRFNYRLRVLGTLAYIAQTVLYIGVMIFAPSLAFAQVSGFNLWAAIFITGIVCTIYTTLGGLKAVIWTDVFQGCLVILIILIVMFMSANDVGGWDIVWQRNHDTGRFNFFDFDPDPRVRHSFWAVVVGLSVLWISIFGSTQSQVQRYLACSSIRNAKKSMYFCVALALILVILCVATGWVMYAYFHGCDPLLNKEVSAPDQLLPYMVLRIFRNNPGVSGAFMAAVYAGCLSTVSSGINAMACVTSEDFIRPFTKYSEATYTLIAKGLVFLFGFISIGFACLSSILGNVLQTSLSLLGILGGPTLGIYTLGAIFPMADSLGSGIGFVFGVIVVSWMYGGSIVYPAPVLKFWKPKLRNIATCPAPPTTPFVNTTAMLSATTERMTTSMMTTPMMTTSMMTTSLIDFNTTLLAETTAAIPQPPYRPAVAEFYAVSYTYYSSIGLCVTLVVGLIVSLINGGHKRAKYIDPLLVIPIFDHALFKYAIPLKYRRKLWCGIDREKTDETPVKIEVISKQSRTGQDNPTFDEGDGTTQM